MTADEFSKLRIGQLVKIAGRDEDWCVVMINVDDKTIAARTVDFMLGTHDRNDPSATEQVRAAYADATLTTRRVVQDYTEDETGRAFFGPEGRTVVEQP